MGIIIIIIILGVCIGIAQALNEDDDWER